MSWQRIYSVGKRALITILIVRGGYSLCLVDGHQLWQYGRSWVCPAPPRPTLSSSWQQPVPNQKFVIDATQNNGEVFGQLFSMYAFANAEDLELTLLTQTDKPRRARIFVTHHAHGGQHVAEIDVLNIQHIHAAIPPPTLAYATAP